MRELERVRREKERIRDLNRGERRCYSRAVMG